MTNRDSNSINVPEAREAMETSSKWKLHQVAWI